MPTSVLIADANRTSLELISAVLARDGFTVAATPDGGDAFARFLEEMPELVVYDENLPVLGGTILCQKIKKAAPQTRVVLLGADRSQEERNQLAEATGLDAILSRPFRYRELRDLLKAWQLISEDRPSSGPIASVAYVVPAEKAPSFELPAAVAPPEALRAATPAGGIDLQLPQMPLPIPLALPANTDAGADDSHDDAPASTTGSRGTRPNTDDLPSLDIDDLLLAEQIEELAGLGIPVHGQLVDFPLPRLLFELYVNTFTGVVHLSRHGVRRSIYFRGGLPVRVDSHQLSENLGRLLVQHGRITEKDYAAAQSLQFKRRLRQGEALIELGLITQVDLDQALAAQTEVKLANSFAWRDGSYLLQHTGRLADEFVVGEVNPITAIWRGVREHYDLLSLRTFFAGLSDYYIVATALLPVHFAVLAPHLRAIAIERVLDGETKFGEALARFDPDPTAAAQALYVLLVIDILQPGFDPGEPAKLPRVEPTAPVGVPEEHVAQRIAHEYLRLQTSNYFQALRIDTDATAEAVDRAYIEIRTELHLDTPLHQLPDSIRRRAREISDILKRAHRMLSRPVERAVYRAGLRLPDPQEASEIEIPLSEVSDSSAGLALDVVAGERSHLEGCALMERQQYAAAAHKFAEAVETNKREPTFRVALGRAIFADEAGGTATARARAMACMQQALQLDPSHIEANVELARLFVDVGLGLNAKPLLERVLRRAPENQLARRLLEEVES